MTVRVRIAPSPTGSPHVGTAYIALFNYCFAKSKDGAFILRIEDTDQVRSKPEYETAILEALRWTGLSWDEGPDVGGPCGPYRQSERTEIYREHARILLERGSAYLCFCDGHRLDSLREAQRLTGGTVGYDGHCMHLTPAQVAECQAQGKPSVLRLKVPSEGVCFVHDPLRGEIQFAYDQIDHQVLMKSDGFPTYHMANVVDDHLMGITHVLRGEEWLPSLPKHLLLYEAFGWTAPTVIHLPLLRNRDQSKLSKRKNPTSILYYKEMGILPEALVNFLGMMAYSMPDGREIFSVSDMVQSFEVQRVHLGGPIFDLDKLKWVNQQHIAALEAEELLERLKQWRFNDAYLRRLVPLVHQRTHNLGDFIKLCDFMFLAEVEFESALMVPKKRDLEETRAILQKFVWELEGLVDFSAEQIEGAFKKVGELCDWKIRDITHAARVAVCGKTVAPPLYECMSILGSDVVRNRLMQAIAAVEPALSGKALKALQDEWQEQSARYGQVAT